MNDTAWVDVAPKAFLAFFLVFEATAVAALSYKALTYKALSYKALSHKSLSYEALTYKALTYEAFKVLAWINERDTLLVVITHRL